MQEQAVIWTEGKTDWQHLKHAFKQLGVCQMVAFKELHSAWGSDQLLKQCSALALVSQPVPTIFVFDRDEDSILRNVENTSRGFKSWGNNVFSLAIPVPPHRQHQAGICIEAYYSDQDLRTQDSMGRRLFLASEFNSSSGRHTSDPRLSIGNKGRLSTGNQNIFRVIDSDVFDDTNHSVALSKADFANKIVAGESPFQQLDFEQFRRISQVIEEILDSSAPRNDILFGGLDTFIEGLKFLDASERLVFALDTAIRACKLTAVVFASATIRYFEKRIVDPAGGDAKKVRTMRQILSDSLAYPSLAVWSELCRHCYHLIDASAPSHLTALKAMMASAPTLSEFGFLLDELERVLPPPARRGRSVNKSQVRKPILDWLLPEMAEYEARSEKVRHAASNSPLISDLTPENCASAITTLLGFFEPLRLLVFRVRNVQGVISDTNEILLTFANYGNGRITLEEGKEAFGNVDYDRLEIYELLLKGDDSIALDLYPFLLIKDHRLYYYDRTKPHGYEYASVFGTTSQLVYTKQKFNVAALRLPIAADSQKMFWAQVTPSITASGMRTNMPAYVPIVGRTSQIAAIMDEIVQIPNQNGIVYGPGGVGKTALLLEVSKQLLQEGAPSTFKNIIWASAKRDYLDPIRSVVETGAPQFESLDHVLTAILEFHEMEDAGGYKHEDKKWLVTEWFRDERTLLIIDNFESLPASAQDEILHFFNLEVKIALRNHPENFKVIFTSRERIPTGLHQISLKGLDKGESKELMQRLYEPYRRSELPQLTDEQSDALYNATRGIPLMIKHCYGQIYEYNRPVDEVIRRLSTANNNVVDFSFAEIFVLLKQDELQRKSILLLELIGRPLMLRQMADILSEAESAITERVIQLVNFQCVIRSSVGGDEKYAVNEDVRIFTSRLVQEFANLATDIKRRIANLTVDKRMDYSQEEFNNLVVFQGFLSKKSFLPAEDFMKKCLKDRPTSILLNLHYAKYLKEIKKQTQEAIELLEAIRKRSGNDQQVLRLLVTFYSSLEPPNFEQAHTYALEVEEIAHSDSDIAIELAQFYVHWATALKMQGTELDPIKEMLRQQKYKELAENAIRLLRTTPRGSHEWHHLLAQSYFDLWEYEPALQHIENALERLPKNSHFGKGYRKLKTEIIRKRTLYSGGTLN